MEYEGKRQVAMPGTGVSWTWKLPLIFGLGTAILLVLACRQETQFWSAHREFTDTPWESQSAFRLLAQILNGPGYYLTFWLPGLHVAGEFVDLGRIPGVIFFWLPIGWSFDQKVQRIERLWKSKIARVSADVFCLFASGVILAAGIVNLRSHQLLPSRQLWHYLSAIGLRGSFLGGYVLVFWMLALLAIFGRKLFRTLSIASNKLASGFETPGK